VGAGEGEGGSVGGVKEVQEACMQVVTYSCSDSVLRVFLAALVRREGEREGGREGRKEGGRKERKKEGRKGGRWVTSLNK